VNVLVLCGDYYHPARIAREGLSVLEDNEFTFDWMEDAREVSLDILVRYPLIILTKSNNISSTDQTSWMTDTIQTALYEYVHNGNGLFAIHSGTAEYEQKPILRSLLGGVFTHHPEQCAVTVTPHIGHREPTRGTSTLCRGCSVHAQR
jgi:type 1 glutamine amidotransferase